MTSSARAVILAQIAQTGLKILAKVETQPGLTFSSCNRSLHCTGILVFSDAEISPASGTETQAGLKTLHLICPSYSCLPGKTTRKELMRKITKTALV